LEKTKLEILSLLICNLTSPIPDSIKWLVDLAFLDLYENRFTGDPPALWEAFQSLMSVYLSTNQISGTIPVKLNKLETFLSFRLAKASCGMKYISMPFRLEQCSRRTTLYHVQGGGAGMVGAAQGGYVGGTAGLSPMTGMRLFGLTADQVTQMEMVST
jgi:hypothetical protein